MNETLAFKKQIFFCPGGRLVPSDQVKMVVKNGVLVAKQKQRRYRTERPFGCQHCPARFTLRYALYVTLSIPKIRS